MQALKKGKSFLCSLGKTLQEVSYESFEGAILNTDDFSSWIYIIGLHLIF